MTKKDTPKAQGQTSYSSAYRQKRDRIEIHVRKGLRKEYREAVAPKPMVKAIEKHMEATVKEQAAKEGDSKEK